MRETHDLDHPEACGLVNVSSDSYPIRTVTIGKYYERNKIAGLPEEKNEDTDIMILELADRLNANVQNSDIEVSHRVGPSRSSLADDDRVDDANEGSFSKPREIIVTFRNPRARLSLLKGRAKLRKNQEKNLH